MARERFGEQAREWQGRLDRASGVVLLFLVAYAPWGANTRVPWLTGILVAGGWLAGALLLGKQVLRGLQGPAAGDEGRDQRSSRWIIALLLILSGALALQIGASVFNPSAIVTWLPDGLEWEHRNPRPGWPTTFDRNATLAALVRYLGLAGMFWAMRDWLLGGGKEPGRERRGMGDRGLPARMRQVVWTLSLSGAAMGLVGIIHRLDKGQDLLWLMRLPQIQNSVMFGSFPSRTNAGQYLNLAWPLVLGGWWTLVQARFSSRGAGRVGPESILVLCGAVMVAAVITAASRMAIAVMIGQMLVVTLGLGATARGWVPRLALAGALMAALGVGWLAQGQFLRQRFENAFSDFTLNGRTDIWAYAKPLADRFPTWGWGAEAFRSKGELHRWTVEGNPEYVHNDWLEARGELGWVGAAMALGILVLLPGLAWAGGTVPVAAVVPWMATLGLGGMMFHGTVDYPFHVPALQATWVLLAAVVVAARWSRGRSVGPGT